MTFAAQYFLKDLNECNTTGLKNSLLLHSFTVFSSMKASRRVPVSSHPLQTVSGRKNETRCHQVKPNDSEILTVTPTLGVSRMTVRSTVLGPSLRQAANAHKVLEELG